MGKKALWKGLPKYLAKHTLEERRKFILREGERLLAKKRRRPVPRVSKATAKAKRAYNARVKVWLRENPRCEACPKINPFPARPATQCHHKHGRGWRGELLMVESLWIPVCGTCHEWIGGYKEKAIALDLLAPKGQWNELPPEKVKS
ncbi:MAG TPA: hypothetical protein VFU31_30440 [Candidatus Binatia bacterium]|nr:hypothetical protein [Candidatus Binatia bacterium]